MRNGQSATFQLLFQQFLLGTSVPRIIQSSFLYVFLQKYLRHYQRLFYCWLTQNKSACLSHPHLSQSVSVYFSIHIIGTITGQAQCTWLPTPTKNIMIQNLLASLKPFLTFIFPHLSLQFPTNPWLSLQVFAPKQICTLNRCCNENRVFPVSFSTQGNPCNENRVPAMRTRVPFNENRFFPVWKNSQGKPCSGPVLALYGIAVQRNNLAQMNRAQ